MICPAPQDMVPEKANDWFWLGIRDEELGQHVGVGYICPAGYHPLVVAIDRAGAT